MLLAVLPSGRGKGAGIGRTGVFDQCRVHGEGCGGVSFGWLNGGRGLAVVGACHLEGGALGLRWYGNW